MKHFAKLFVAVGIVVISGCVSSVEKMEPFHSIVGTTQTIQREALLYRLNAESEHQRDVFFDLYDKDGNNSWRKDGWLPPGTRVQILKINRYFIDERGPWIGVVGLVEEPGTHEKVKFLYCWSDGDWLKRAPWEGDNTPARREVSVLH